MDTKIVDRIRKLLELSKHNTNVNEAASAAALAARLMAQHAIEAADLEAADPSAAVEGLTHETLYDDGGARLPWWRWVLADALCRANGCKGYGQGGGRLGIIGRASNAQTVRYLFGYLVLEIERLCSEIASVECPPGAGSGYARTWRNSFRLGAA